MNFYCTCDDGSCLYCHAEYAYYERKDAEYAEAQSFHATGEYGNAVPEYAMHPLDRY